MSIVTPIFPAPRTWVAGELITPAMLDEQIYRTRLSLCARPAAAFSAAVVKAGAFPARNITWGAVEKSEIDVLTNSEFAYRAASIRHAGLYEVRLGLRCQAASGRGTTQISAVIRVNGTEGARGSTAAAGWWDACEASTLVNLQSGDWVEAYWDTSDAAGAAVFEGAGSSRFSVRMISPTL
ncbi:hypothetical protein [Embleya hyalina]|uniref:Uncharacterized protein n=1 Tax=Embleya hyalina TaxID=516124 RepID=A0A401YZ50_9ACTN|nr:hypothetical protein [Embleya hyalina]GCD99871.1 hypothetical protein EHYA_07593 [Embleya hyalina]